MKLEFLDLLTQLLPAIETPVIIAGILKADHDFESPATNRHGLLLASTNGVFECSSMAWALMTI